MCEGEFAGVKWENSKESKNLFVLPVLSEKRGQEKRKAVDLALFKK